MDSPPQDVRRNGSSKQPALFRWAWVWAGTSGAVGLICYRLEWRESAQIFFIAAIVLGTIAEISSRYTLSPKAKSVALPETSPEEFYMHFPDPGESGWLNYTVIPSENSYKEELCFGGPPADISTYEYTVKVDQVFGRLVDLREEDLSALGVHYEVVNGQVLEAEIRIRSPYNSTDGHIERLRKGVIWHEVTGSLRYFILSKHGGQDSFLISFFCSERQRLEKGFAALAEKAAQLGGVRELGRHRQPIYQLMDDVDEQAKTALSDLQQAASLERFGISFQELRDYEHVIQTLDTLISGSETQA